MVNTLTRLNGEELILDVEVVDAVWVEQHPVLSCTHGVAPLGFWLLFFFSSFHFFWFLLLVFNSICLQLGLQLLDFSLHLPVLLLQLPVGPFKLARRLLMLNDCVEVRLRAPLQVKDVLLQTLHMIGERLWPKLSRRRPELPRPDVSTGRYLGHLLVYRSFQSCRITTHETSRALCAAM